MRKVLAVAVVAVFAATLTAQDKVDTAKEGKFKATFPSEPKLQKKTAGGLSLTAFRVDKEKGGGFVVFYSEVSPDLQKGQSPGKILELAENALKDGDFKATVNESTAYDLGTKKYPARKFTAAKKEIAGEWNLRGTIVLANNRLYQVYVYGPQDLVDSKEAKTFLDSFEVVE